MTVTLLGLPWDAGSSYMRGPAFAPDVIRSVLHSEASSPFSLSGKDFRQIITHDDFSSLPADPAACRAAIAERVLTVLKQGRKPLSLGGDHSVTYPVLCALRGHHGPVNILHIDAHTDLYDEFEGDKYSHACPFRRAVEDGCVGNLVQIGLRSVSPDQRAFGEKHGVVMLGAADLGNIPYQLFQAPLYISVDLDGFDPAFAPGVSHQEPGGLTTREVLDIFRKLPVQPIGADIVELNPERDIQLMTAHVAARLVKELVAMMAENHIS